MLHEWIKGDYSTASIQNESAFATFFSCQKRENMQKIRKILFLHFSSTLILLNIMLACSLLCSCLPFSDSVRMEILWKSKKGNFSMCSVLFGESWIWISFVWLSESLTPQLTSFLLLYKKSSFAFPIFGPFFNILSYLFTSDHQHITLSSFDCGVANIKFMQYMDI